MYSQKRMERGILLILCGISAFVATLGSTCQDFEVLGRTNKPKVNAPADLTVECDGQGNQAELAAWLDGATTSGGCPGGSLSNDFKAIAASCGASGSVTVTWTALDSCGGSGSDSATFTIVDSSNPNVSQQQPIAITCGDPGDAGALAAWLVSATASDACGAAAITTHRSTQPGTCTATIIWTATDDCGNAATSSATYTTNGDTAPPTSTLNGDAQLTIECGEDWQDPGATVADDCDALIQPNISGIVDPHTPGVYVLTYSAIDACGNAGPDHTRTVTVSDTTPPVVTLKPTPQLWPPNHRMDTLTLADLVTVDDACEGTLNPNDAGTILDIYSDEPDNSTGDGNTTGDIAIPGKSTFAIRVERRGNGNGRVYGVRFEVTDSSGNSVETTAFVHVPHDQSGSTAVDDGAGNGFIVTR